MGKFGAVVNTAFNMNNQGKSILSLVTQCAVTILVLQCRLSFYNRCNEKGQCFCFRSQAQRFSETQRMVGRTNGGHLVQPPCSSLLPTIGYHPDNFWISPEKKTPQSFWAMCSVTLTVKMFFLLFKWNILCSNFCHCPFCYSALLRKAWFHSLDTLFSDTY